MYHTVPRSTRAEPSAMVTTPTSAAKAGSASALVAVGRCLELVGAVCEGRSGRVVKTIGDEAMTVFRSVDDTAEAAAEVQAKLAELAPVGGTRLAMRIGFHFGPAIEAEG